MTETLTVRDGTIFMDVTDPELWEALVDATSFRLEGAEYRRGGGDKRTKLVSNSKAPLGLLDRICRTIQLHGATARVTQVDTQMAAKSQVAMRLYDVEPRDYQIEAEMAAILNDRGIFRLPTGSGKTLLICQILAAKGTYGLVIVPTIDLLRQTRQYLADHLARDTRGSNGYDSQWTIGQLGDGVVNPQPITVATIRTIAKVLSVAYESYDYAEYDDSDDTAVDARELKAWVESLGTVIVDEAHQLGARVLYETVTRIPASNKYGMSASPWRDDGADLMIEAATGPPICYIPAKRLVDEGYLMAPHVVVKDTSSWWTSAAWGTICTKCKRQQLQWARACACGNKSFRSQWTECYREEIVLNSVRNSKIAEIVRGLDRPTLVLVKQVKHGRDLADFIPGALFLSGKDKGATRQDVFDRVRAGHQRTIVTTQIGDMGLDIPNLGALVLAGGGKSSTRHLQRIGRIVRPVDGKPTPLVIDFNDAHIHTWFAKHEKARRRIEHAEWDGAGATWAHE